MDSLAIIYFFFFTDNVLMYIFLLMELQLDVLAKERQVAGLRASLNTLTSEIKRLNKLCAEWKEAEDSLKKKWKKIEEFDARRSELECIYTALCRAIMVNLFPCLSIYFYC
jgi:predicted nuclease with TOPRIM domain